MHRQCWAAIAALCALAIAPAALAQRSTPAGDAGEPLAARLQSAWPRTLPQSKPGEPPGTPSPTWSAHEIEQARARCAQLLEGLDVVVIQHAPIREGECGAPAPMRLVSVGSNPQIAFSPPPVLTCEMVAALHRWLERDVQPLARRHLGAPLVAVATMSSFSCRRAYGRANGRLSEHGRVNAIDIAGFLTAKGQTAVVIADWGPIARDIAAKAIAAQAKRTQTMSAARPDMEAKAPRRTATSAVQALGPGIALEFPAVDIGKPTPSVGLGWAPPSPLGGPKPADRASSEVPGSRRSLFLRTVHGAACKIFATVLGPEANKAHRNHFHLDMAERNSGAICE